MSAHHRDDELPTLDTVDLRRVTGGAGDPMSMMLPMMMMKHRGGGAAAAAPPAQPAPWVPKILVDGVEQKPTASGSNGTTFNADVSDA